MKDTEWSYIAGLIDGEGTFYITKNLYPRVSVRNTNEQVLVWIHEVTGVGRICSDGGRGNHHECFSWTVTTKQLPALIKEVLPYLHIKWGQANAMSDLFGSVEVLGDNRDKAAIEKARVYISWLNKGGHRYSSVPAMAAV